MQYAFLSLFVGSASAQTLHRHRQAPTSLSVATDAQLTWTFPDTDRIRFTVTARTQGWVAVGVSNSGAMKGADIAVVRRVNGEFVVEDRYSGDYVMPTLDRVQNVRLVAATRNATHTVATVERALDACDRAEDLSVPTDVPVYVLWAYGTTDEFRNAHATTARKTVQVTLMAPTAPVVPPSDPGQVTLGMRFNTSVVEPGDHYLCISVQVPAAARGANGMAYLIKSVPVLTSPYVHHFVAFACASNYVPYTGSRVCMGFDLTSGCGGAIVALWAPGAGGERLPDELAYPIVGPIVLQIHYSNPSGVPIPDVSGMDFTFTPQPRRLNAGMFVLGVPHEVAFGGVMLPAAISLPARHSRTQASAVCPSALTAQLPAALKVYGIAPHMHIRGRRLTITQVRDGVTRKLLDTGDGYDFNFQGRVPMKNVTIEKGDILHTECTYDTNREPATVYGGEATNQEMCYAFFLVSPPVGAAGSLGGCVGLPTEILPSYVQAMAGNVSHIAYALGFSRSNFAVIPDSEYPPYPDPTPSQLSSWCSRESAAALLGVSPSAPVVPSAASGGAAPPFSGGVMSGDAQTAIIALAAICGALLLTVLGLIGALVSRARMVPERPRNNSSLPASPPVKRPSSQESVQVAVQPAKSLEGVDLALSGGGSNTPPVSIKSSPREQAYASA